MAVQHVEIEGGIPRDLFKNAGRVIASEAEARPTVIIGTGQPQAQLRGVGRIFCQRVHGIQFVETVEDDTGALGQRRLQFVAGFPGAVEDDLAGGCSQPPRQPVFHPRHHLGPSPFVMEDGAERGQVIGLVGKGHMHGKAGTGEGAGEITEALAQHRFGHHEQGRAVGFQQIGGGGAGQRNMGHERHTRSWSRRMKASHKATCSVVMNSSGR